MTAQPMTARRFVRRTQLGPGEYRKNFHQLDREVIAALTSPEADAVTPLMSKIYLGLVNAPDRYWEREGVLRFEGEVRDGQQVKAWKVLCEILGVASATASKAIAWMHKQEIIGYFSGKNGVGLRVFLNRAASSIGVRQGPPAKKILDFARGSSRERRGSPDEPAFNDPYGVLEVSDKDLNPRAPKNGAEPTEEVNSTPPNRAARTASPAAHPQATAAFVGFSTGEVVSRLLREIGPAMHTAAAQAAAREHERTREWLESRGLPKAARVAQREAFNVLRHHGLIRAAGRHTRSDSVAGQHEPTAAGARLLAPEEVRELAETCVAMLEVHGQAIDATLAELSAEAGGVLLAEDAPKVRKLAEALACGGRGE